MCIAVIVAGCTGTGSSDPERPYFFRGGTPVGHTIPTDTRQHPGGFTGELLDGGDITLAQQAGKVVVINFWATWCGPCTTETPQFDSVYRDYRSKGVQFIGIDTKNSPRSLAQAFVKDNDITYPIVFDQQGKTALALGRIPALALPFTVIVDKQQRIAAVYLSRMSPKDLEPVLDRLIAEM